MDIELDKIPTKDMHQFLLSIVAPRPIAFVSTVNEEGVANLAPFSFFNCFSSNPPIVIFSASRRVSDNTTKHTLENIMKHRECVINAVSYPIVRQMAVASVDFPEGTSEFGKAGLTPVPSLKVKPPRVKECLAHLECVVDQILPLGDENGAGNLIICRVVHIHVDDTIIDDRNRIDPHKLDLMGRMGKTYYARASGDAVHSIIQPYQPVTIGYDNLPEYIKKSSLLTANDIGILAGLVALPTADDITAFKESEHGRAILASTDLNEACRSFVDAALEAGDNAKAALGLILMAS